MAIITEKQTRRNRVQFTMPRNLFEAHQRNLELAKELGAIIDFNRDFERWFITQVDQVAKELGRLQEEATRQSPTKPKAASTMAMSNHTEELSLEMTEKVTEVSDGIN